MQSCELFEAHPFDGKVSGETNINAKNIALIKERCSDKQTIRFVFMGDTHRYYDDTNDFVHSVNARNDVDFVIHGGDVSDFGMTREFMHQRDIMNKLHIPYVALFGNHDHLGTGNYVYREIFGTENFAFMAGNTKFVCLNTNALEYDYSLPVPDFGFIEQQLQSQTPNEKTVVVMHSPPYCEEFNNNVVTIFQDYVKQFSGLQFCLNSHIHDIRVRDMFDDGVIYFTSASPIKRRYLLFTISPESYSYEVVSF
ncbi:MAG: metallophosphoesterase [Prevotellaceae bacterium]|nr:metallophosphoesterase [Prevotellaceae bacterium]